MPAKPTWRTYLGWALFALALPAILAGLSSQSSYDGLTGELSSAP